jgi:hypothetical protein
MINQKQKRINIGGTSHSHSNNPNSLGYGQTIYGLHRLDSITDIEFSNNYLPDRLFMQELSTRGRVVEFHMENIIFRKIVESNSEFSFQRQSDNLFTEDTHYSSIFWKIKHFQYLKSKVHSSKGKIISHHDFLIFVKLLIPKNWNKFFRTLFVVFCYPTLTLNSFIYGERRYEVLWSSVKDLNDLKMVGFNLYHIRSVNHIPYLGNLLEKSGNNLLILEENFDSTNGVYIKIFKENNVLLALRCVSTKGFMGWLVKVITESLNILLFINRRCYNSFYINRNWSKASFTGKLLSLILLIFNFPPTRKQIFVLSRKLILQILPRNDYIFNNFQIKRLFVTPGNMPGSSEIISLGFAKRNNIFSGVLILSWDNTNSKGTFVVEPTKIFCWNNFHSKNLIEIHHLDEKKLFVSGPLYLEKWNKSFIIQKLLDAKTTVVSNYVLFLGSSANIYSDEINILRKMKDKLKENEVRLELVYRPHPSMLRDVSKIQKMVESFGVVFSRIRNSVIENIVPDDEYIELLVGAKFITGINTSAFIDALILKLPVHPVLINEANQISSLHFKSLLQEKIIYPLPLDSFSDTPSIPIVQLNEIQIYFPFIGNSSDIILKESN